MFKFSNNCINLYTRTNIHNPDSVWLCGSPQMYNVIKLLIAVSFFFKDNKHTKIRSFCPQSCINMYSASCWIYTLTHCAEKERLPRTRIRNVCRKCKPTIKKLSWGEESLKTALHCSDDQSARLSDSFYYMKSHIKKICLLCKLFLNWCILCVHFVLTQVKHGELCLFSLVLRIAALSPFWLIQTSISL